MTDSTKTADETYKQHQRQIEALIGLLQDALKIHAEEQAQEPQSWGYVGDLGTIVEELGAIVGRLSGAENTD